MHMRMPFLAASLFTLTASATGQTSLTLKPAPVAATAPTVVPALVRYSGVALASNDKPVVGEVGMTFMLYAAEQSGEPLWTESQTVAVDATGHYQVELGANSPLGMPLTTFASGEGRWLEVQIAGQTPQPRVFLSSVPYAMKAADAATLGGLPASAFALAGSVPAIAPAPAGVTPDGSSTVTTPGGTSGYLPVFSGGATIDDSLLFEDGTSIGIGTKTPAVKLDVAGGVDVRGALSLPDVGTATATAGADSQPILFSASAYNSSTKKAVSPEFQLQAEPAANDTSAPGGTLNLLYGNGATPAETGLSISSKGIVNFASNQTFPGTASLSGQDNFTNQTNFNATESDYAVFTGNGDQTAGEGLAALGYTGVYAQGYQTGLIAITNAKGGVGVRAETTGQDATSVSATASGNGATAVFGAATAGSDPNTGAPPVGIYGQTAAASFYGYGVVGLNTVGSQTLALGNAGVAGFANGNGSNTGLVFMAEGYAAGVWGDATGNDNAALGVVGTADQNYAGYFVNNGGLSTVYVTNGGDGYGVQANTQSGSAGIFSNFSNLFPALYAINTYSDDGGAYSFESQGSDSTSSCTIDTANNLLCSGTIGGRNIASDRSTVVETYAVQSTENWYEDAGSGQLAGGVAHVDLDPVFGKTVNTSVAYQVFLTPNGDCKGLYVSAKSVDGFEVHELGGGTSSIAFDYRIMAKRNGFENVRLKDITAIEKTRAQQMEKMRHAAKPAVIGPNGRPRLKQPANATSAIK